LPTLHHTGFVVTDLERSIAFYAEHFGAEVELCSDASGADVAAHHGLDGEADFSLAILRIGDGLIELLEFRTPADREVLRIRGCDVSSFHVAIEVDDIDEKRRELAEIGVEFTSAPLRRDEGDLGVFTVAFLTDPDGNRIELVHWSTAS
jgi:catechol 2,3-dioxygenase-like lactoylglutathione lyase family enzyme